MSFSISVEEIDDICFWHRVDEMGHKCMNTDHGSRYCEYAPLDMGKCSDFKEVSEEDE